MTDETQSTAEVSKSRTTDLLSAPGTPLKRCFYCGEEIASGQSRCTDWVDSEDMPVKTVHRTCRNKARGIETTATIKKQLLDGR